MNEMQPNRPKKKAGKWKLLLQSCSENIALAVSENSTSKKCDTPKCIAHIRDWFAPNLFRRTQWMGNDLLHSHAVDKATNEKQHSNTNRRARSGRRSLCSRLYEPLDLFFIGIVRVLNIKCTWHSLTLYFTE